MPVYRKHGKPEYTYDFKLRGHRFFGPTGTSNKRQAERILEQKRQEALSNFKKAAGAGLGVRSAVGPAQRTPCQ